MTPTNNITKLVETWELIILIAEHQTYINYEHTHNTNKQYYEIARNMRTNTINRRTSNTYEF